MPEAASKFETGVEAMRAAAIEKVMAWHVAEWNMEPSMPKAEVHQLLNSIIGDIRIAVVQGT